MISVEVVRFVAGGDSLQSSAILTGLHIAAKGATFKEITLDTLRKLPIPLPPRDEQAVIAQYIDNHFGAFRDAERTVLTQTERLAEYRQALITAAVTGQLDVSEAS